ncbi:MAG: hypothetical protein JOY71_08635 [Acetobacteraceae bacterium]|nr:hypothetical protein [Acetobacteraceae bacterium]MBV8522178.1 hypothetical protein [Acetobacteraceae bacterium]
MKTSPPTLALIDPDKMFAVRKADASPWELHERAIAGELAPAEPCDPGARF